MPKELVISAAPHETRVAILEDGQLCEIYIEREKEFALVGSIYKGRVTRVLPGMQSAFVDIGLDSDAFLYVGDFLENLEDYDHVVTAVEGKVEKMEQQGGVVFAPPAPGAPGAPGEPGETAAPDLTAAPTQPLSEPLSGSESHAAEGGETQPASYESTSHQQPQQSPQSQRAPFTGQPPGQPFGQQGAPPFRQERRPGQGYRPDQRPDQRSDYRQGQGQGPREGQGHDRGGRQRGGRLRRGRGGDRRPGRDLPPSKYASPRPYVPSPSRPYEPPTEETAGDYTPVILPGESLAKYKDRIPGASSAPPGGASDAARKSETPSGAPTPAFPSSLYASPGREAASSPESTAEPEALLASEHPVELESEAGLTEPDTRLHETQQTLAHETLPETFAVSHEVSGDVSSYVSGEHEDAPEISGSPAVLSDDEAASLAEQVAEARQEEASANADAAAAAAAGLVEPEETDDDATSERFLQDASAEHDIAEDEGHESDSADTDDHIDEHTGEHGDEGDDPSASDDHGDDAEGHGQIAAATGETSSPADAESAADDRGNVAPTAPLPQRPMTARVSDPQRARFQRPMRRGNRQRGNRPRHQDHRHQAARRPQLISEMLKAGQEIIVQIAKEPLGKKGARITSHVALPGRFLVYMPTVNHIGVSRRIGSSDERSRLRRVVTESKGTFPGGFIVRTAAEGAPEDEIRSDVEFLGRTWDKIRTQAEPRKSPALLHR
ncbi:MAG TPA: ribonuclease E/G, partial [Candidatus Acidoferrales bacterium]